MRFTNTFQPKNYDVNTRFYAVRHVHELNLAVLYIFFCYVTTQNAAKPELVFHLNQVALKFYTDLETHLFGICVFLCVQFEIKVVAGCDCYSISASQAENDFPPPAFGS